MIPSLARAVEDYVDMRRGLGFKLREYDVYLRRFVRFLSARGASHITGKLAVEFATKDANQKPVTWAARLIIIRGFARYRFCQDPKTEIPDTGLLPFRSKRARPYRYSVSEIRHLLHAALTLESPHAIQPRTYYCLFGLLAVSGLRLGEAIGLEIEDVNWPEGVLTIHGTKFGKSRLVPIHRTTRAVLMDYSKRREKAFRHRPVRYFFVSSRGTKLAATRVGLVFRDLSQKIGIRAPGLRSGPRLHDFRHRFAVETLIRWYRNGEQVTRLMPVLSTYLGHGDVTDTYWYLTNTPELMAAAGRRLEDRWRGVA